VVRRTRSLNLLVAANAISLTGNVMGSVAVPWFVLTTTGSAALTGVAAFAATGPMVIGSLVAGRIVDRLGPRATSVTTDVASGATVALIPLLFGLGRLEFWHIVALLFAGTVFDSAGAAARLSLVPAAARAAGVDLERANARFGGAEHIGYVLGAPLAGLLIAVIGPANVLWLDAASFGLSAALLGLGVRLHDGSDRSPAAAGSLRAAVQAIRGDRVLLTLVLVPAAGALLIDPLAPVILPVYARQVADSPVWLGIAVAAYGVGGLAGLVGSGRLRAIASRRRIYLAVFAVWPILYGLLAPLPLILPATALVFAVGLIAGLIAPIETTVVQERAPPELLPRIVGVTTAVFRVAGPIAILVTGVALESFGLTPTLVSLTIGTVALALAVWLDPGVRRFDDAAPSPTQEALTRNGTS
jgi:predicted MFS family arabinose efflux permease